MVLAHNLTAMNAQRQFNIVGTAKKKSTEKLSSGYKINRAADDAAGLSISEKMRKQIRGLDRASDNCQDGVSLCQVADGALAETQDMLQRLTELSVQAANGTLSSSDRDAIQKEVNQIKDEINRISDNTKFNEVYPLKGNVIQNTNGISENNNGEFELPENFYEKSYRLNNYDPSASFVVDGITYTGEVSVKTSVLGFKLEDAGKIYYSHYFDSKDKNYDADYYNNYRDWMRDYEASGASGGLDGIECYSTKLSDLKIEQDTGYVFLNSKNSGDKVYFYIQDHDWFGTTTNLQKVPVGAEIIQGTRKTQTQNLNEKKIDNKNNINIHAGADSDMTNKIGIHTVDASTNALGISNLNLTTEESATNAIEEVGKALQVVSDYRSYFGAMQNRMEHTIANLDNVVENTQAAESRIRDTDMAKEMVNNTKLNVLEQAVTSMLAQANQSTQGVLSLLQ